MFPADWAFGFRGALERSVREHCPQLLRSWPLLQSFNFEAYTLPYNYALIVLRDKLSGVPAGAEIPSPFQHTDHPSLPPTVEDITLWQFYIRQTFGLAPCDAGFLVPVYDSGKSDASADYAMFNAQEKFYWHHQLVHILSEQKLWLESIMKSASSNANTYNVTGPNARVNVGSTDNSTNVVTTDNAELFNQLRALVQGVADEAARTAIASAVNDMEQSAGKTAFIQHYTRFISVAADHVGLFGPLLPALSRLLGA
jgi:hypothetical protein